MERLSDLSNQEENKSNNLDDINGPTSQDRSFINDGQVDYE